MDTTPSSQLSYITLWVHKYEAALAFYRDTLGLELKAGDENFASFACGGCDLNLHRLAPGEPLRSHSVEIHFAVADVDAAYEMLRARGATFESAPADMPWGSRMAALRDPEGYGVEIVGPPLQSDPGTGQG